MATLFVSLTSKTKLIEMKQLLSLLAILTLSLNMLQAQDSKVMLPPNSISFQWNAGQYLFYDTDNLQSLDFTYSVPQAALNTATKKNSFVDKVEFNGNNSGKIYFKKSPNAHQMRAFLETAGISEFFVNNKQVYTETLLTKKELEKLAGNFKTSEAPFQAEWNKPDNIGYYSFRVYHMESKIQMMRTSNYPNFLYTGKVAEYTTLLNTAKKELECFQLNK